MTVTQLFESPAHADTLPVSEAERVALGFVPPHPKEAEQSVLGGLMLDNTTWDLIADVFLEEDFFFRHYQLIFRRIALLDSQSRPNNVVTIAEVMPVVDGVGGLAYLRAPAKDTPRWPTSSAYAEIVPQRALAPADTAGFCQQP